MKPILYAVVNTKGRVKPNLLQVEEIILRLFQNLSIPMYLEEDFAFLRYRSYSIT